MIFFYCVRKIHFFIFEKNIQNVTMDPFFSDRGLRAVQSLPERAPWSADRVIAYGRCQYFRLTHSPIVWTAHWLITYLFLKNGCFTHCPDFFVKLELELLFTRWLPGWLADWQEDLLEDKLFHQLTLWLFVSPTDRITDRMTAWWVTDCLINNRFCAWITNWLIRLLSD